MSGELTGQQLGPFTIDELISSTPLIDTYSGYDADPEQRVVVKIVKREPTPEDDDLDDFRREARAIAGLRHPNIARVFDFGETGAGRYVVSREIDGVPLSEALAEAAATGQTFSPDDAAFVVRQVAAALHEAHRQGVVHRALTPQRILLTRSAQAIVTDFGLALLAGGEDAEDPLGAREYSAPEVQTGTRSATPAADVYSLAVIAYELLTGQRPYSLDSELDRALRDLADTAPDPRIFRPSLPRAVTPVLQKGLATAPGERFESAMAFASALERALDGDAVFASEAEREPVPEVSPPPAPPVHPARERRRPPITLARIVVVAVVLLLFAGAGALLLQAIGLISLPFGPRLANREPEAEVAAEPSPTPTPEPTNTPPPSPTPEPSPTGLPVVEPTATLAPTPTPPPLVVGSSAFRLADGAELRFIPAGSFLMGTDDPTRQSAARPQHEVHLADYWLDLTEVTNAQYALCVEDGACTPPVTRQFYDSPNFASHPVTYVQHTQAVSYCLWLARETGEPIGLPTEAQWEKAAAWDPEAGEARLFPWGNQPPNPELLRYAGSGAGAPAPVGTYPDGASAYGVLDMAGNVWEWVADWFAEDTYQSDGVRSDPTGPATGTRRVTRGGGWLDQQPLLVSNVRNWASPTAAGDDLGFRCALNTDYPSADTVALTPLELTAALEDLLADARPGRDIDREVAGAWEEAIASLAEALRTGDDETARAIVEERLARLTRQRTDEQIEPGLAYRLDRALLWMRDQLAEDAP